jgi:hypothetical protein
LPSGLPRLRQNERARPSPIAVVLKRKVKVEHGAVATAMSNLTFNVDEKTLLKAQRVLSRSARRDFHDPLDDQLRNIQTRRSRPTSWAMSAWLNAK